MTQKDIARQTGTSVATVSKAFSGSPEISEETRQRIFDAARRGGCYEKYYKGGYDARVVAVICPEMESEYYTRIVSCLEKRISAVGDVMTLSVSGFDAGKEKRLFEYHAYVQKADGVILLGGASAVVNRDHRPLVAIHAAGEISCADLVETDIRQGMRECVSWLKEAGHREIGFVGDRFTAAKRESFREAMRELGLPVREEWTAESALRFQAAGYEEARRLLAGNRRPTAVIAAYDYIALGVIQYAHAAVIRVPEELSVIGMDNISLAPYLDIPLTTVDLHTEQMCDTVLELLYKKMENPYYVACRSVTVRPDLMIRGSAGPAPGR